jgi:hypothetical protein
MVDYLANLTIQKRKDRRYHKKNHRQYIKPSKKVPIASLRRDPGSKPARDANYPCIQQPKHYTQRLPREQQFHQHELRQHASTNRSYKSNRQRDTNR